MGDACFGICIGKHATVRFPGIGDKLTGVGTMNHRTFYTKQTWSSEVNGTGLECVTVGRSTNIRTKAHALLVVHPEVL